MRAPYVAALVSIVARISAGRVNDRGKAVWPFRVQRMLNCSQHHEYNAEQKEFQLLI